MQLIRADFPDPDIIRVGNVYYMITTTMHMFPGGDLLSSADLVHWKLCSHVYTTPAVTKDRSLEGGSIYGKGMWAATLRYHKGIYHVIFVCNDTRSTCHYTASSPEGPWERHEIPGFYHDCSLLFDDDGRVLLAYGNREIHITEMKSDLSAPLENGLDIIALRDEGPETMMLGFEGTHFYKLNGQYYLFFIHWPSTGNKRRTQACYTAKDLCGPWTGGDILDDDMGFCNQGVAQGGIVDTPDGKWYTLLFQDSFAMGRAPVLCSFEWENGFPVRVTPLDVQMDPAPLFPSDSLKNGAPDMLWQWNHLPDERYFRFSADGLHLVPQPAPDAEYVKNSLTQRTYGPLCACEVTVDIKALMPGARAGLLALQGCYAGLFLEKMPDGNALVLEERLASEDWNAPKNPVQDSLRMPCGENSVRLCALFDYRPGQDTVRFFLKKEEEYVPVGHAHRLVYRLDHFMGCRAALCCYTKDEKPQGEARFFDFAWLREVSVLDRLCAL